MQIDINIILRYNFSKHEIHRDFPGDPVFKTSPSNVGVQVRSLIGEPVSGVDYQTDERAGVARLTW